MRNRNLQGIFESIPDYILIKNSGSRDMTWIDDLLELRIPDEVTFSCGLDELGDHIFIPIEHLDDYGQPMTSEWMGYGNDGNEVWLDY